MFNNYDQTLTLYCQVRQDKTFSLMHSFLKLKHLRKKPVNHKRLNKKGNICTRDTDPTGGFLHRSQLQESAKALGIAYNTLHQRLSQYKKRGWVKRTATGWRLIGWRKVIAPYAPELTKIKFFAPTTKELNSIIAYQTISRTLYQQAYKRYSNSNSKNWLKRNVQAISRDAEFSISCRTLADRMGFKSGITGCRYEHRLKRAGLLKIKRRTQKLCPISDFGLLLKCEPDLWKRCFTDGEFIYERLCNHLILKAA